MLHSLLIIDAGLNCLKFSDSFNALEDDAYLKQKYCFRKRAFSEFRQKEGSFSLIQHRSFFQETRINQYSGGIERWFPPIDSSLHQTLVDYIVGVKAKIDIFGKESIVGFHQIRITCEDDNEGYPVPEGHHQDGVEYVGIVPINKKNVCGGLHSVRFGSQDGPEVLSQTSLEYGQTLILNDRNVFHYASPIYPQLSGRQGTRDSLIFTVTYT